MTFANHVKNKFNFIFVDELLRKLFVEYLEGSFYHEIGPLERKKT